MALSLRLSKAICPARLRQPNRNMLYTFSSFRHLSASSISSALRSLKCHSGLNRQIFLAEMTQRSCLIRTLPWTLLNLSGKQLYAKKLPFEVDIKVLKDTTLYKHTNPRFFKMLSIFGIAQLIFWGQLSLFTYTSLEMVDSDDAQTNMMKESFWGKILQLQNQYKYRISAFCVAIGILVGFFTYLYPRRNIRQLDLLKGGEKLLVTTYSHFARSRSFNVPVDHLSVAASRAGKASQVSLKLKGHRFFYLMDKSDGKFYDTRLFDYAVGLKRDIK